MGKGMIAEEGRKGKEGAVKGRKRNESKRKT